jgi:hypothetical protein
MHILRRSGIPRLIPLLILSAAPAGCGYRLLAGGLPAGVREVQVRPPRVHAIHEPELARLVTVELVRQLGRAGIHASTARAGATAAVLRGQLLALETIETPLDPGGRRLAGRLLRLRLELVLEDRAARTLWRSGVLEVDELAVISTAGPGPSEAARRGALARIALRVAEQAVELMTSGL